MNAKKTAFVLFVIIALAAAFGNSGSAEIPGGIPRFSDFFSGFPSFSPTPTPPADRNERSWERWWYGNRAPLLVQLSPAFGPVPKAAPPKPTMSGYVLKPGRTHAAGLGADKLDVPRLLVLLGYGGPFKEITREMVVNELHSRGKAALDELIAYAVGARTPPAVAGMSSRQLKNYAVLALGEIASPECFEPLAEAFRSGELDTAFFAAVALGRLGDPRAIEVLSSGRGDTNQYLRAASSLSLGMLGDIKALDVLERRFLDGVSNEERIFAALAMGMLGSKDPKAELLSLAKTAPSPLERAFAAWSYLALCSPKSADPGKLLFVLGGNDELAKVLVLMGSGLLSYREELKPFFAAAANDEESPLVRKAALLALAMSNSKTGHEMLLKLEQTLTGDFAKAASFALALMKKKTRNPIIERWTRIEDPHIRSLAPFLVARYLGGDALDAFDRAVKLVLKYDPFYLSLAYGWLFRVGRPYTLEHLLSSGEPEVRAAVVLSMGVSGADWCLRWLMKHPDLQGEEGVARRIAMVKLAPAVVLDFFKKNAPDRNPRVAVGVASALGALKAPRVEEELSRYLNSYNPDVRCYAAVALARVGSKEAGEILLERLAVERHPFALGNMVLALGFVLRNCPADDEVRKALEEAMFNRAHAEVRAFSALAWAISHHASRFDMIGTLAAVDRDPRVRAAAALALGIADHESSIFALRRALAVKAYKQVREYGCYGMGVLKDDSALGDLVERLKDTDIDVRMAASISLGALRVPGGNGPVKPLAESDASTDVRRVASIALMLLGDAAGFDCFVDSFKGRGSGSIREMGWEELTEVSNLYVPVGFRIDDYLQDLPIPSREDSKKEK